MTLESMVTQADRDCRAELERHIHVSHAGPFLTNDALDTLARHRTAAQPEREAVSTRLAADLDGLHDLAWVFDQAEIWTPNAETTRMNGPRVAAIIREAADEIAALTTPAPAVSADEIDELLYSVIRMPLSNKGGELVRWRKTMSGRLSAILSRLRGENP